MLNSPFMWTSLVVTGLDIALKLHARDVAPTAVLLPFERTILNAVVQLSAAHAQDSGRLGDFKSERWQKVRSGAMLRFAGRHELCL
jgi:hypothetical protein